MNKNTSIIKLLSFILILFTSIFNMTASPKQSSQIIKAGHWIYEDLALLTTETKTTFFLETQPLSVGEIRFYLRNIDVEKLSNSAKAVYNKIDNFINDEDDFFPNSSLRLFTNMRLNPEFMFKSNKNIPWSYLPRNDFKDVPVTFPILIGFSDYFTIESDLGFDRTDDAAKKHDSFMNISFDIADYTMFMPYFCNFSATKIFDDWGITAHLGKEGMKIGNTSLGSIIYNDTFKTDFYTQLNLFTDWLKFTMTVSQISYNKYIYLHELTLRPFKNFTIGVLEGSLVDAPFELRFLNPLMIMHSFKGWKDYDYKLNTFYGGESSFCAYLGFTFEYLPIKNLRIYGLYAQNEIVDFGTLVSKNPSPRSLSWPNSIGAQLGVQYFVPLSNDSHIRNTVEASYASPYLYIKHTPESSMIRRERDEGSTLASWIGSPVGPDSFVLHVDSEYDSNKKWSAGIGYNLTIHGENTAENLFIKDNYSKDHWIYYPSVQYDDNKDKPEVQQQAIKKATNMWMSGTPEYKHEIKIKGHYQLLDNLDFSGHFGYTFVFNNNNLLNNFQQGIEFSFITTFELF